MTKFTDFFIERPVFATALSLLLFVIGLIAYNRLAIREYPAMSANSISITTAYTGANAETVESFITTRIENAISGVDNIDYIKSSSSAAKSKVVIYLTLNADVNTALEDVNSDLAFVIKHFPDGVDNPVVKKVDPDATPAMVISFASTSRTAPQITEYLSRTVIPQLVTVSGVGSVDLLGDRTYAMRLWLNPLKMAALNVSADDVQTALDDNNIQAQPGAVQRNEQVLTINAKTDIQTPEEFSQLVIKHQGQQLVRLSDVGTVELGATAYNKSLRIDGQVGVGVGLTIKSSANPLDVSIAAKKVLDDLQKQMPADMSMIYAQDNAKYIQFSVNEVIRTIFEAAIFVFMVIYLFLGSLRAVLIPIVTIPLSLITTFAMMFMMGFSINILTLLAFVFAIGMVVDDAIVVLENIHRHIESGLSPLNAALKGAREIVFVVIAMTFTLVAVYAPIGFTTGLTSILFKEFAFTLAASVVISGFIALTLSPMMCSKFMRPVMQKSYLEEKIEHCLSKLTQKYQHILNMVLNHRLMVVTGMLSVLVVGAIFFMPLYAASTLAPNEDQGLLQGKGSAPTGASIAYTEKYTQSLQGISKTVSEIVHSLIVNGSGSENNAMLIFQLKDWSERHKSADMIQKELMQITSKIPGMKFAFYSPSSLPGSTSSYSTEFILKSTGSYQELYDVTQRLATELEQQPGVLSVDTDLKLDSPEITVSINRNIAAALGVSMTNINTALNLALGQPTMGSFVRDGQSYDVIPQLDALYRNNPNALNQIYVRTETNVLVPLANMINLTNTVAPSSLNHFQQQRAVALDLVLASNYSQQQAIDAFVQLLKAEHVPEYMTYDFSGDTRQFVASGSSMLTIFIFSLVFIYLVLSAQFESFIDPFIVMLTVPLALVGALITLYIVGASLNIYTEIGLITLIGLISKHGILMVAFANQQLLDTKLSVLEAIRAAAAVRLRPILMTTAAVVLGALPLVFASGAGAVARSQMGWTITGGMLLGTLLTLFVIPTMYTLFKSEKNSSLHDEHVTS